MGSNIQREAQLTRDAKTMFKVADNEDDNDECAHKDFGPKKRKKDQEYVQKLNNLSKVYNPFDRTSPDLLSITTGNIAVKL
jgi:hypothetical protein